MQGHGQATLQDNLWLWLLIRSHKDQQTSIVHFTATIWIVLATGNVWLICILLANNRIACWFASRVGWTLKKIQKTTLLEVSTKRKVASFKETEDHELKIAIDSFLWIFSEFRVRLFTSCDFIFYSRSHQRWTSINVFLWRLWQTNFIDCNYSQQNLLYFRWQTTCQNCLCSRKLMRKFNYENIDYDILVSSTLWVDLQINKLGLSWNFLGWNKHFDEKIEKQIKV